MASGDLLEFTCDGQSIRFLLPDANTDFVQRCMVRNRTFWEARQLKRARKFFPEGGVLVDAGAFVGNHTVYFAKLCRASRILAFEPQADMADVLERNIVLNQIVSQVLLERVALGSRDGTMAVSRRLPGTRAGTAFDYAPNGTVTAKTLDAYSLTTIHLLKIDVEGAELSVLQGARETIRRCRPVIWLELCTALELEAARACLAGMEYDSGEDISEMDYLFFPRLCT